jgi:Peptidase S46
MRQKLRAACAGLAAFALSAGAAAAAEGMWTFDNFPAARMRAEMGWAPDQAWLDRVMAATARLPECSGANVSARGLVLTNQHCLIACLQALSGPRGDVLARGLTARTLAEERRCPNFTVRLLSSVTDVTARIDAATAAGDFARARDAEIARLESGCGGERCEVVMLYQGARYALYRYRHYDDVRLVFAPEHAAAAFGGEADNFTFPRYCADFALVRLYVNGAPAATPAHLSLRFDPLAAGDIVLTAGNPGATSRLKSAAELAFERDVALPWQLAGLSETHARLAAFALRGAARERRAAAALQGVENARTALAGRLRVLADAEGFARIVAREQDLQARVRRNRAAQREVGDAWGEIARALTAYREFYPAHQLLDVRAGERSDLFAWARELVRGAGAREQQAAPTATLTAERVIDPAYEELHLEAWLTALRARLTDAQARYVFADASPAALARTLAQSRLAERAYRLQIWRGGAAAIAAADDPMIAFVRSWDDDAQAVRAKFMAEVETPMARARERIAVARFRAFGEDQYPEANFSPRLSYGRIEGWREADGREIAAFTRVDGLYAHATAASLALSASWIAARARLAPDAQLNLASSNDVSGGNSGSPLLDRAGRVVGVVFDGNPHALGGEYFYNGETNRAVSVAAPLIQAALAEVYDMDGLLAELRGD